MQKQKENKNKENNSENMTNEHKKQDKTKLKKKKKTMSHHRDKKVELIALEKFITDEKNNSKAIKQRIDISWMDIKETFWDLVKQKKLNNVLTIMFNKASKETKYEMVEETVKNLVRIASHEYSRGFILHLSKYHSSYLKDISEGIKKNSYELISSRNGVYVVDEVCKELRAKHRKEIIEECVKNMNSDNVKSKSEKRQDFPVLVYKLFSKKLLKYEIVHELFERVIENDKLILLYDIFVRNKQLKYFLLSYKGLNFSLRYLEHDRRMLELILTDLEDIVNDVYGVVFVLKVLEMNDNNINDKIIDFYLSNYKTVFANEFSAQPLIYLFNQDQKYFSSLFNQKRTKDKVNIDKENFIRNFSEIVLENIEVFINSFTYLIVFFLIKKNQKVKNRIKEIFNEYVENPDEEYKNKLYRKIKKYKIIKF